MWEQLDKKDRREHSGHRDVCVFPVGPVVCVILTMWQQLFPHIAFLMMRVICTINVSQPENIIYFTKSTTRPSLCIFVL